MSDHAFVDARGLGCPWPVLRLAKAMRDRTQVTIAADDPRAAGEIAALATARGWTVERTAGDFRVTRPSGDERLTESDA